MTDSCFICQCEAIDISDWYFNEKNYEFICPWCVKDMEKLRES